MPRIRCSTSNHTDNHVSQGGAKKGPCTGTSGYLAHYEIQDILNKNKKRDLTVVHDKEAAVKYLHWDNDQWISFDDADTFKQKKDWANSVGFSGSLIWASDLDDYDNTAHKAFTGNNNIGSRQSLGDLNDQNKYAQTANSFLGQGCKFNETVVSDVKSYDCGKDMELVAYDTHGCKGDKVSFHWYLGEVETLLTLRITEAQRLAVWMANVLSYFGTYEG
jgi:chitinase